MNPVEDCSVCGDTGELPVALPDDEGILRLARYVRCPYCCSDEDDG